MVCSGGVTLVQGDLEGGSHDSERLSQFPFLPPFPPGMRHSGAAVEDVQADRAQEQVKTLATGLCNVPAENEACWRSLYSLDKSPFENTAHKQ